MPPVAPETYGRRFQRGRETHAEQEASIPPLMKKGVHYAMKLSGHRSDRYIWRYVQPSEQSLAEALDELE